jgi:dipeptidyl aminopeptidase/acylaminoacyl peptidase
LAQDSPAVVNFDLKLISELPVPLYAPEIELTPSGPRVVVGQTSRLATLETGETLPAVASLTRLTRFTRRDQNPTAPLQALNSFAITPDGKSAILSVTSQDESGQYYASLLVKPIEDDRGSLTRLLDNPKRFFDANPVIVPGSGNLVIFQSNRDDPSKIDIYRTSYLVPDSAGGVVRLTVDQRLNYGPTSAGTNQDIVYLSIDPALAAARPLLGRVKFDGTLPVQFPIAADEASQREPSRIYFTRRDELSGKRQIHAVDPDGKAETSLLADASFLAANCFNPSASTLSPGHIVFVSDRDADSQGRPNNNLYLVDLDGSQPRQLTANGADDILPVWSPVDPKVIYFLSNRGGAYNLWRLRLK